MRSVCVLCDSIVTKRIAGRRSKVKHKDEETMKNFEV